MKTGLKLLGILLVLQLGRSAAARDFEGGYAVYGAGAEPCSVYLKARNKGGLDEDLFTHWLIGYLSAFNLIMPSTYDILGESDFTDAQLWMEDHCRKFPHELFINATAKLTEILYPTRYQSSLKKPTTSKVPTAPTRSLKDIKIR